MYCSVALFSHKVLALVLLTANVGLGEITMRIYLDAPQSYGAQATSTVVIAVRNRTDQPIRTLDFAGFLLRRSEKLGEWTAQPAGTPAPASQPVADDLDPDLSTVTLEIASASLPDPEHSPGLNVSRGIGHVVIGATEDHFYGVDVGRCLSRPGDYQLRAVLTKRGKVLIQSPIRTLRIGTPLVPATQPAR